MHWKIDGFRSVCFRHLETRKTYSISKSSGVSEGFGARGLLTSSGRDSDEFWTLIVRWGLFSAVKTALMALVSAKFWVDFESIL
jgi:hypothetical protein